MVAAPPQTACSCCVNTSPPLCCGPQQVFECCTACLASITCVFLCVSVPTWVRSCLNPYLVRLCVSGCLSVCFCVRVVEKPHTALCCLFSVGAAGLTFAEQELRQHELLLAGRAALRLSDISPQVGTSFLLITSYLCAEKALRETREHLYSFYGQA